MAQMRGAVYVVLQRDDPAFSLSELGAMRPASMEEITAAVVDGGVAVAEGDGRPPAGWRSPRVQPDSPSSAEKPRAPTTSDEATTLVESGAQ
jgi:hypothetical protein